MGRIAARASLGLLLVVSLARCDGTSNPDNYGVRWVLINNTNAAVDFKGQIDNAQVMFSTVPANATRVPTNTALFKTSTIVVNVIVSPPGQIPFQSVESTAPVEKDKTTDITVIWDGVFLSWSAVVKCLPTSPQAVGVFEPSANVACDAPVWRLDHYTGSASNTFSDVLASGTGSLTTNFPATVQEGETVAISATYSGTVTVTTGTLTEAIDVGLADPGIPGFHVTNSASLGQVTGSKSGSVTVNQQWVVPTGASTIELQVGGNFATHPTSALSRKAIYVKIP